MAKVLSVQTFGELDTMETCVGFMKHAGYTFSTFAYFILVVCVAYFPENFGETVALDNSMQAYAYWIIVRDFFIRGLIVKYKQKGSQIPGLETDEKIESVDVRCTRMIKQLEEEDLSEEQCNVLYHRNFFFAPPGTVTQLLTDEVDQRRTKANEHDESSDGELDEDEGAHI
jgi:hypothetical protein